MDRSLRGATNAADWLHATRTYAGVGGFFRHAGRAPMRPRQRDVPRRWRGFPATRSGGGSPEVLRVDNFAPPATESIDGDVRRWSLLWRACAEPDRLRPATRPPTAAG